MKNELSVVEKKEDFELSLKVAENYAKSGIIPTTFQKKPQDVLIALEMANRLGASPLMLMQNMFIVYGKPAFSTSFLIACFNSCGKFSPLEYEIFQEKKEITGCRCKATCKENGKEYTGPLVTMEMARKEGWVSKSGSKWVTMPQLMLRYRAAAFFIRTTAPELTMGLHTDDEIIDMEAREVVVSPLKSKTASDDAEEVPYNLDASMEAHVSDASDSPETPESPETLFESEKK